MWDNDPESDEFSLMVHVGSLIRADACGQCLVGKAAALELFVAHLRSLTRLEKKAAIFTALSILYVAEEAQPRRVRSTGVRIRFSYYLPFVGRVWKTAFLKGYDVSAPTISRYRRFIREGRVLDEYEDELY